MAGPGRGIRCAGCWEMELNIPLFLLGFLQVSQALAEFCAGKSSSGRRSLGARPARPAAGMCSASAAALIIPRLPRLKCSTHRWLMNLPGFLGAQSQEQPWDQARGFSPGFPCPSPSSRVSRLRCVLVRGRARSAPRHGGSSHGVEVYRAGFGVYGAVLGSGSRCLSTGGCIQNSTGSQMVLGEMAATAEPARGWWLQLGKGRSVLGTKLWHSQRVRDGHSSSSLHPTLHADARRLHPSRTQRWVSGERGRFSPRGRAGYQGCCSILHPAPGVPLLIPLPCALATANGPFISRGGTNGAVRCHQPCDMTGCGSRGPSNRAALSVRAA